MLSTEIAGWVGVGLGVMVGVWVLVGVVVADAVTETDGVGVFVISAVLEA